MIFFSRNRRPKHFSSHHSKAKQTKRKFCSKSYRNENFVSLFLSYSRSVAFGRTQTVTLLRSLCIFYSCVMKYVDFMFCLTLYACSNVFFLCLCLSLRLPLGGFKRFRRTSINIRFNAGVCSFLSVFFLPFLRE